MVSPSPRRALLTVVALVVAIVAIPVLAIVLLGDSQEDSPPAFRSIDPIEGPGFIDTGDEQTIFEIELGDCLQEPVGDEITSFNDLPCRLPHDMEVFHLAEHPSDGPYPGDDELVSYAEEVCLLAFPDFVGLSWIDSTLDTFYLYPQDWGWRVLGDREIVCMIYDPAGPVEGSLEGAGR